MKTDLWKVAMREYREQTGIILPPLGQAPVVDKYAPTVNAEGQRVYTHAQMTDGAFWAANEVDIKAALNEPGTPRIVAEGQV